MRHTSPRSFTNSLALPLLALACLTLGLSAAIAPEVRADSFYLQAAANDFVDPACDTGRISSDPATCSAAADVSGGGSPYHFGSDASSVASLAQGLLKAEVSSFGSYIGPDVFGQASAAARLFDTLTFHGPIGPTDTVTITMTANLTYTPYTTFAGSFGGGFGLGSAFMELQSLGTDGSVIAQAFDCTPGSPVCANNPGFNSGSYVIDNNGNLYSISETVNLSQLADSSLQVLMYLGASSSGEGSATADDPISVTLPAGITYTSASGLFLTQVPEPGTLASVAPGLLALVLMRRRSRKSRR